ncbi:hypothetical protein BGZ94_001635 [Podila epigama]|nr:hypothetical protein BGZ94_001635 [Podila epigama]
MIENKAWGDLTESSFSNFAQSLVEEDMDCSFDNENNIQDNKRDDIQKQNRCSQQQDQRQRRRAYDRCPEPNHNQVQHLTAHQLERAMQESLHLGRPLCPAYNYSTPDNTSDLGYEDVDQSDGKDHGGSAGDGGGDSESDVDGDYDNDYDYAESDSDGHDHRYLPELTINLVEPEASHFDELLYYLYTGDGPRWKIFFRPDNYIFVLQNIAHLNILTRHVFEICLAFEQTTQPEMHLQGLVDQLFQKRSVLALDTPTLYPQVLEKEPDEQGHL